ncbi:MAG TPA: hypothetical protein DCM22_05545 [Lachnospiraceae bacterium]|nr:hypothetical protein [Lachnospiraceae bacterium]
MKRRNLDNHSPFHKTGHTSKGDQRKWKVEDRWYKVDYMGYESLAEVLVSHFLEADERKRKIGSRGDKGTFIPQQLLSEPSGRL